MFDTPADAAAYLNERFTPAQVETVTRALAPTISFTVAGAARTGGTRLGGTPDFGLGVEWPIRKMPENAQEIAARGNADAGAEMLAHFRMEPPYAFVAQVDLAEAAKLGSVAADLPDHGRLLFFYDLATGPWDTGTGSARVVWDQSPTEQAKPQPMPAALEAAAETYRKALAKAYADMNMNEHVESAKTAATPYMFPARTMTLKATLRPPNAEADYLSEDGRLAALNASEEMAKDGDTFQDAYSEMLSRFYDPYYGAQNRGHIQQLLGLPVPEQSDPRLSAFVTATYGVQHLSSEDYKAKRDEIRAGARDWRLLLQIGVSDLSQDDGEGAVYFVIRREDLKERRFDRVMAVYQQT